MEIRRRGEIIMSWTKTKIITALVVLLVATTAIAFKIETHKDNSWRTLDVDSASPDKMPGQVTIVPTKFSDGTSRRLSGSASNANRKVEELGVSVSDIVAIAYDDTSARQP
jgi:hypothetical protein